MYGVFWTTPPQSPASTVAPASTISMSRARYSSPAAAALSVLSMPPMIVTSANGSAIDRYGSVAGSASTQTSVGHGSASPSAAGATTAPGPAPAAARSQKMAAPASTAANAPGRPNGMRTPPRSASSSTPSATTPTSGSRRILSVSRNAINRMATPPIEPSSAARGTTRRAQSPPSASSTFTTPIATVAPMPTFHASAGSRVASITGPSTPKTIANRVGVSMPKGIAVTSSRPVRRASRTASHVYARSPRRTPSAVPGTMRPSTRSGGKPKTPIRSDERMTSCVRLSSARPRNPLRSPAPSQRGERLPGPGVGASPRRDELTGEARDAPGERRAPGEAPAVPRDLAVVELERVRRPLAEPQPGAVRGLRARLARVEQDLHARAHALGVRGEEGVEPALDLVVAPAGEHAGVLGQHSLKPQDRHFLQPSS